jgi:hypothetical protein
MVFSLDTSLLDTPAPFVHTVAADSQGSSNLTVYRIRMSDRCAFIRSSLRDTSPKDGL